MPHAKARLKLVARLSYDGWADGADCLKSATDEHSRNLNYADSSVNSGSYKPLRYPVSDLRPPFRDGWDRLPRRTILS